MSNHTLYLDTYLKRVQSSGPLVPTVETLRGLHRAQTLTIPFENLDVFLERPIQ